MSCRTKYSANLLLIVISTLLFGGCSYNPFTTRNHLTGSVAAPIVGATAGGGAAAILGANRYFVGLAGLGGGALGYYLSSREFAASNMRANDGQVLTQGKFVTISLPIDYIFDTNSTELLPQAMPALRAAIKILSFYPESNIIVSGNSSGFGTQSREQRLSEQRARVIADFLWKSGVDRFKSDGMRTRRLTYIGYGNYFPISNNIRAESIRQNSRIQITGYPSRADLKTDTKGKLFANIGRDEEPVASIKPEPNIADAFRTDQLPETLPATHRTYNAPFKGWKGDANYK